MIQSANQIRFDGKIRLSVYRFCYRYLHRHNPVYSRYYQEIHIFPCTMGTRWDGHPLRGCTRNLSISSLAYNHLLKFGSLFVVRCLLILVFVWSDRATVNCSFPLVGPGQRPLVIGSRTESKIQLPLTTDNEQHATNNLHFP